MPAYLVTLNPARSGLTLRGEVRSMVIFAASAALAKEVAAASIDGDGLPWSEATATEIVAATDWAGWTFRAYIYGGLGVDNDEAARVEVVADATTNTIDEVGAALVTALNALSDVSGAAYDNATNVLTVTGAADSLGDQKIGLEIIPPGGSSPVPGLVGAITDEGLAGAATTVALPADDAVVPAATLL